MPKYLEGMFKKFVRHFILRPAVIVFGLTAFVCWSNARDHQTAGESALAEWITTIFYLVVAIALYWWQRRLGQPLPGVVLWARQVLENRDRYVILDTETTGYGATAEVIQIAISDLHGNPVFVSKVRPVGRKTIPLAAQRIHGLTMQDLKEAPTWVEMCQEVRDRLQGKIVLAYNAKFDERLIRQTVDRYNTLKPKPSSWSCLMLAYAEFIGQRGRSGKYKWHKLPGTEHEAMADCRAALRILEQIASGRRPRMVESKPKKEREKDSNTVTIDVASLLASHLASNSSDSNPDSSPSPIPSSSANDNAHPLEGQEGHLFTCLYPDSKTGALVSREFKLKRFDQSGALVSETKRDGAPVQPRSKRFKLERMQDVRRVG